MDKTSFFSYDLSATPPRAVAARNIGNIKKGGMDAAALANKFAGRGGLTEAFLEHLKLLKKLLRHFHPHKKSRSLASLQTFGITLR